AEVPTPSEDGVVPDAGTQPLEEISDQEVVDAEVAPVLDSAKETKGEPTAELPADPTPPPATDAEAQAETTAPPEAEVTATVEAEGQPIEALTIEQPQDVEIVTQTDDNRFIFNLGINLTIFTPYDDRDRIGRDRDDVSYERLD